MDLELLEKIEKALDIKFKDWQKDYMLDIPRVLDMRITGRCTGKTLVYIIKLLFSDGKPLNAYEIKKIGDYSDWFSVTNRPERKEPNYTQWFRRYLQDIYTELEEKGIRPRPVFFSKKAEKRFYAINRTMPGSSARYKECEVREENNMSIYSPKDFTKQLYINTHQGLIHAPKDSNYTLCGMMIKGNPLMKKTEKETTRDNFCNDCYLEMLGNMFKK